MADFEMQVKFVRKSGLSKKNQGVSSALRARTKGLLDYCNQLLTMAANVQWPEGCVSCHLLPPSSFKRVWAHPERPAGRGKLCLCRRSRADPLNSVERLVESESAGSGIPPHVRVC